MKTYLIGALLALALVAPAISDPLTVSGVVTSSTPLTLTPLNASATCSVSVSGTWTGTINVNGISATSTQAILLRSYASDTTTYPAITANGLYYATVAGVVSISAVAQGGFTGSATTTLNCSSAVAFRSGSGGGGTVTSVTGTPPIASSGGATPAISCAACVTAVTASGNLASSGGTTPAISMSANPSFSSVSSSTAGYNVNGTRAMNGTNNLALYPLASGYSIYMEAFTGGLDNAHFPDAGGLVLDRGSLTAGSSVYGPVSELLNGGLYLQGAPVTPASGQTSISGGGGSSVNFNAYAAGAGYYFYNGAGVAFAPVSAGHITATDTATTTQGPVAPCYTSAGAACGGTFHVVRGNGSIGSFSCTINTTCGAFITLTFSGAAVFASGTSYACYLSHLNTGVNGGLIPEPDGYGITGSTYYFYLYSVLTVSSVTLTYTYTCEGT